MQIKGNTFNRETYQTHKYIAKNLRFLRCIKGLSQDRIAKILHMSRSCYCGLESGLKVPDFVTVCEISAYYDVSLDYLITFDITEHLLSLLKQNKEKTEPNNFMEKYLQLSHGAKIHIRSKLEHLLDCEREFNQFPREYNNSEEM